jgi:hypothetical protein
MNDMEGYPPGSTGSEMRRIRAEAEALGAAGLVAEVDAFDVDRRRRALEALSTIVGEDPT